MQDGFTSTLDEPPHGLSHFYDLGTSALTAACLEYGLASDCWVDSLPQNTTFNVTIPEDASHVFGGHIAFITTTAENVTIHVEGETWVVRGLWTWSGLDNALEFFRNFLASSLLAVFITVAMIVIPPMRTAREAISSKLVPGGLL